MSKFYNYDTRGASAASQVINLERMVEERDVEIERLNDELAICRDAIERAYDFVVDTIRLYDDDMTQGAGRATLRMLNEAVGKATPRLLYEREEGMTYYGLRWRERNEEIKNLKDALFNIFELAGWHTDDTAEPGNQSPEDMTAHVNGLIRHIVTETIKE